MPLPALIAALTAGVVALSLAGPVRASSPPSQEGPVTIVALVCPTDPEAIIIANQSGGPVDLVGWRLESNPVESQVFDLGIVGLIDQGEQVTIESGSRARGLYVWSTDFILRDGPSDFVRIVDSSGSVLQEMGCPAMTATATPSPTALGEVSPPGDVPHGGGNPAATGSSVPSASILLGGTGALMLFLSFLSIGAALRLGTFSRQPPAQLLAQEEAPRNHQVEREIDLIIHALMKKHASAAVRARSSGTRSRNDSESGVFYLLGAALAVAAGCLLMLRRH